MGWANYVAGRMTDPEWLGSRRRRNPDRFTLVTVLTASDPSPFQIGQANHAVGTPTALERLGKKRRRDPDRSAWAKPPTPSGA